MGWGVLQMGSDSQSLKLLCTLSFPGFLSLRFNITIVFLQHLQQSSALRPSQVVQFQSCDFWPDLHGMIQDIESLTSLFLPVLQKGKPQSWDAFTLFLYYSYPILSRFSGLCSSPALILWRPDQFFLFLHTSSISHGHILWFNFLLCCGNAACPFCQHTAQWQLVQLLITLFFVLCIILPALQTYILYWHTLMPLLLKITKEKAYLIELFFLKLHRSWSVNHCSIQSLLQITVASPCYNFSRQYPSFWPGLNQDQLFDSHPLIISTIQPSFTASTCNNSFLTFR